MCDNTKISFISWRLVSFAKINSCSNVPWLASERQQTSRRLNRFGSCARPWQHNFFEGLKRCEWHLYNAATASGAEPVTDLRQLLAVTTLPRAPATAPSLIIVPLSGVLWVARGLFKKA